MPNFTKAKLHAEFTMGVYDYKRYDAMLMKADEIALMVRPPQISVGAIHPYYSILRQLYINFRAIVSDDRRIKIDKFFRVIEKQMLEFSNTFKSKKSKVIKINPELLSNLEKMHIFLLELKQIIGLGINVVRQEALKKKLERALLGLG